MRVRRGNNPTHAQSGVAHGGDRQECLSYWGKQMSTAFVCEGTRTPIGRYGGALAQVRTDDLAAIPLRTLREQFGTSDWEAVDEVFLGCANQSGEANRNGAGLALLR